MFHLVSRLGRRSLAVALIGSAALAAPALAAPVAVTLRVEGSSATTFEGSVTTDGHDVTTASGGTHHCDGTNGGQAGGTGPVATAALDDASKLGRFSWDGRYFSDFDDFLVDRVAGDSATATQFWGVFVNGAASQVGGCQQRVKQGDEVVWAFDAFSKAHSLRLTGPGSTTTGRQTVVNVRDAATGAPIPGASVAGAGTGGGGNAAFTLGNPGGYRLKGGRAGPGRSNALVMCVDPPGAPACTSTDKSAPTLKLLLRNGFLFQSATSRTFFLSWQAQDGDTGSGVGTYDVDVRDQQGAGKSASDWRPLARGISQPRVRFRGSPGKGYDFRVAAVDRAGNRSSYATAAVLVPIDERDKAVRRSRGWRTIT